MSGIIKSQGDAGDTGKIAKGRGGEISADDYIGMIQPFGMAAAPAGWLICDGTAVSRTTYARLFAVISTTWGNGDGSTTFGLPRLQGLFLKGSGTHGTSQMGNTNAYQGGNIGTRSFDQKQEFQLSDQSNLVKIGGPQYLAGFVGRTIGSHGHAFRTGFFHYDHTQGGNSPFSSQFSHHGGISSTDNTLGGTKRVGGECKPFSAAVEYMIYSGVI